MLRPMCEEELEEHCQSPQNHFYEFIIKLTPACGPGGSLAGTKEQQKLARPYRTDILEPLSHCEPWLD